MIRSRETHERLDHKPESREYLTVSEMSSEYYVAQGNFEETEETFRSYFVFAPKFWLST